MGKGTNVKCEELKNLFSIIKSKDEPSEVINDILKFVIDLYQADRAYIFEIDSDLQIGSNTYEICAEGVKSEIDNLQAVPHDMAPRWGDMFLKQKTLFISNVDEIAEEYEGEYQILKSQDIKSLIAVPFNNKNVYGYLGIDNPKTNTQDDSPLIIMSHMILNELVESRLKYDLISTTKNEYIKSQKDIYIKTFGQFEINTFLGNFKETEINSNQCFLFLIYLLLNRGKYVTIDKLTSIIWKEQNIYEPYNYIKNVAFRTRKMLKNFIGEDIIVAKDGSYAYNSKLNIVTDYEILEQLYEVIKNEKSKSRKKAICDKIIELYTGSMLPKFASEEWLVNIANKYKSIYIDIIEEYVKMLFSEQDYLGVLEVTEQAIKINGKISLFHYYTVIAYIELRKSEIAQTYLETVKSLLSEKEREELTNMIKQKKE